MDMAKPGTGKGAGGAIEKRGGYEPGPKTVSQLAPPPKNPGAGSKPSSNSSGSGNSSKK